MGQVERVSDGLLCRTIFCSSFECCQYTSFESQGKGDHIWDCCHLIGRL